MEMGGNFCQILEFGGGATIKGWRVQFFCNIWKVIYMRAKLLLMTSNEQNFHITRISFLILKYDLLHWSVTTVWVGYYL